MPVERSDRIARMVAQIRALDAAIAAHLRPMGWHDCRRSQAIIDRTRAWNRRMRAAAACVRQRRAMARAIGYRVRIAVSLVPIRAYERSLAALHRHLVAPLPDGLTFGQRRAWARRWEAALADGQRRHPECAADVAERCGQVAVWVAHEVGTGGAHKPG